MNNLLGGPQFVADDLAVACSHVCAEFGDEPAQHWKPSGWYSIEVLCRLFEMTSPPLGQMSLEPAREDDFHLLAGTDMYHGILVNKNDDHWVCIVPHHGHVFYVDSVHAPTEIDMSDFKRSLELFPASFIIEKDSL